MPATEEDRAACGQPKCNAQAYCLCVVYREAKQRCIDKGEGWRWGIGARLP